MYVRTMALVTNLAVHVKTGAAARSSGSRGLNDASWYRRQRPHPRLQGRGARRGQTDRDGTGAPDAEGNENKESCPSFVFAQSGDDIAFTRSDWTRASNPGASTCRGTMTTTATAATAKQAFHTILPRNLLRPGETVHMKHYARDLKRFGTGAPDIGKLPKNLSVVNEGNNQRSTLTLDWNRAATR